MKLIKNRYIFLVVIFLIALFLRFYQLDKIPPGPEWDEASVGYNAYSIAQTGRDEWGNKMPLIFPAFGDYKNPLYIYLTAPIVKLFGLNIITTRFINAFSGGLLVLVWFTIAQLLFSNIAISLLTALLLAVSPFGLFFSRIAGDGIMLSVFLISLGLFLEICFLQKKKPVAFYGAIIALILSMFSYNLGRVVSPILMLIFFIVNFFQPKIKITIFIFPFIACFLCFFIIFQQSKLSLSSRLKYVGIFGADKGVVLQINEYRDHDKNNLLSKIVHNKLTFFLITISSNYLSHFSSNFLTNMNIHVPVSESLYPPLQYVMFPFYYLGILLCIQYLFVKTKINRLYIFLIFVLFFIAPLPSTITEGAPSSKRNLAQLGCMELFVSVGFVWLIQLIHKLKNKIYRILLLLCLIFLFLFSIFHFLYSFYIMYPKDFGFMYARKEAKISEIINRDYSKYDYFVFSRKIDGVPYIFPLFYRQTQPNKYWETREYRLFDGWFYIDSFDKYLFYDEINPITIDKLLLLHKKRVALFMNENEATLSVDSLVKYGFISKPTTTKPLLSIIPDPNNILYQFSLNIP
jgi:4-amino-4-deoxy-L-arabinose transferase-like glycosyltransferase